MYVNFILTFKGKRDQIIKKFIILNYILFPMKTLNDTKSKIKL